MYNQLIKLQNNNKFCRWKVERLLLKKELLHIAQPYIVYCTYVYTDHTNFTTGERTLQIAQPCAVYYELLKVTLELTI